MYLIINHSFVSNVVCRNLRVPLHAYSHSLFVHVYAYVQENEDVVLEALSHYQSAFLLVDVLPDWKTRGVTSSPVGRRV